MFGKILKKKVRISFVAEVHMSARSHWWDNVDKNKDPTSVNLEMAEVVHISRATTEPLQTKGNDDFNHTLQNHFEKFCD